MKRVTSGLAALLVSVALLVGGLPHAQAQARYSIEKIFYGFGWKSELETGLGRRIALLNLTEGFEESYPGGGLYSTFKQLFVEFSSPIYESGPEEGSGLRIRLSYYVDALCYQLNESVCPLGILESATSQDIFDFEVRRILEFRDGDDNGTYDPGETVVQEVLLAQPILPFVDIEPFGVNWSQVEVSFNWNRSWEAGNITQGAIFAGDPLLEELWGFRITMGTGIPMNLTVDSFLFLQPSIYLGIPLTPSELKLDIHINNISYVEEETSLALEVVLSSSQYRFQSNSTGTSETLATSSAAAEAFFSWNSTATVDGEIRAVGSKIVPSGEAVVSLYLTYPRGESITHDPVLGVVAKGEVVRTPTGVEGTASAEMWVIGLASAVAVSAGVGAFVLVRRHRPGGRPPG